MSELINTRLKNFLNDVNSPERIPCFIHRNVLRCYFNAGDYFDYNPRLKIILLKHKYILNSPPDTSKIDASILDQIFLKLTKPKEKTDDEVLIEKYNLPNKKIRSKLRLEIYKYEQAIQKGSFC